MRSTQVPYSLQRILQRAEDCRAEDIWSEVKIKLPREAKLPGRKKLSSTENLDERSCPADQSCQEEKCQTERKCRADQSRAEQDGPVETSEVAEIGQR